MAQTRPNPASFEQFVRGKEKENVRCYATQARLLGNGTLRCGSSVAMATLLEACGNRHQKLGKSVRRPAHPGAESLGLDFKDVLQTGSQARTPTHTLY